MLTTLTHAAVLSLSSNRQFNLSRRELLRPHLNKDYQALCNAMVPITKNVLGDDLNKQVDDLTKANKIGLEVQSSGKPSYHPYGRGLPARAYTDQIMLAVVVQRLLQKEGRLFLGSGRVILDSQL